MCRSLSQPAAARADLRNGPAPDHPSSSVTLSGSVLDRPGDLIPVCSWCGKVRDRAGAWTKAEAGAPEAAGLAVTHGVCPACAQALRRAHDAA